MLLLFWSPNEFKRTLFGTHILHGDRQGKYANFARTLCGHRVKWLTLTACNYQAVFGKGYVH